MNFFVVFLVLFTVEGLTTKRSTVYKTTTVKDENELTEAMEPQWDAPRIQIRAIFVRCVREEGAFKGRNASLNRNQDILKFYGYDKDEPFMYSDVKDCWKKLVVTMKLTNGGKTQTEEEFIVVDHVFDPISKRRMRIMNPVIIKVRQDQVMQAYGLHYVHVINAEAKEEVMNKDRTNFTGCDASSTGPTCGVAYYKDKIIPYSEVGFCCSCDTLVNMERQPEMYRPRENVMTESILELLDEAGSALPAKKQVRSVGVKEGDGDSEECEETTDSFHFHLDPQAEGRTRAKRRDFGCLITHRFDYLNQMLEIKKRATRSDPWEVLESCRYLPHMSVWESPKDTMTSDQAQKTSRSHTGETPIEWSKERKGKFFKKGPVVNNETSLDLYVISGKRILRQKKEVGYFVSAQQADNEGKKLVDSAEGTHAKGLEKNLVCRPQSRFLTKYGYEDPFWLSNLCDLNLAKYETHFNVFGGLVDKQSTTESGLEAFYRKILDHHLEKGRGTIPYWIRSHKEPVDAQRPRRQITSSGTQIRGGQSCIERHVPVHADPVTYHESAHCLRFSELWYTVYRLKTPFIEHSVDLRVFEKQSNENAITRWIDLTRGMDTSVGTFRRHVTNAEPSISFTYTPFHHMQSSAFCLDPSTSTLLVPRPLPPSKREEYPQAFGGPKEYMLVKSDEVTFDGEECDKAGISYSGFAKQPDRCGKPRGTCLKNQPADFWNHDMDAKKRGVKGKYFLENFAIIPEKPVKRNKSSEEEYLSLEFTGTYSSAIEIELKADSNAVIRPGTSGQLSEIYVDATCDFHTRITILVSNTGLVSSAYQPRLSNCPVEVPTVWTQNEGPVVTIPPQHKHLFKMSLFGHLPVDRFHCSVELLNDRRELVATRRIRVQRFDRCLCMWYCLCACIGSVHGLKCEPMSAEHYHAAGFLGSLPVYTEGGGQYGPVVVDLISMNLVAQAMLLFFGFLKALFGLCSTRIATWGLWLILPDASKQVFYYLDPKYQDMPVLCNQEGYPVNPCDLTRTVQFLTKCQEFSFNLVFFLTLPGALLLRLFRVRACCGDTDEDVESEVSGETGYQAAMESEMKSGDDAEGTMDPDYDCEFVDTEFVIEEMKKTRGSVAKGTDDARSRGGADTNDQLEDYEEDELTVSSALGEDYTELMIEELVEKYIVYRNLNRPLDGVSYIPGSVYSIRGFFHRNGTDCFFKVAQPFEQHWTMDCVPLTPPILLDHRQFELDYYDPERVFEDNELSLTPRGVVINVWWATEEIEGGTDFPKMIYR